MKRATNPTVAASKTAIIYALVSILWILFSDQFIGSLANSVQTVTILQMLKGWAFVLLTSILIFLLMRREMNRFVKADVSQRASEANFRLLVENAPDAIFVQTNSQFAYLNPAAVELFGAEKADQLLTQPVMDRYHPNFHPVIRERIERVNQNRQTNPPIEQVYLKMDGTHFTVEVKSVPIEFHGENGALVYVRDVTARKTAEETLRRFELLVENSRDVIFFINPEDGHFLFANTAAVSAYGYNRDDLLNLRIQDLREPDTVSLVPEQMAKAVKEGILFETIHRRKDGSTFPVEISSRGATINGVRTLISVCRDITYRKKAEQRIEEWRRMMDFIIRHDPNAIAVYDEDLRYIFVSERYLDDYKVKDRNIIGKHHYEVFPEMPERWKQVHQRVLAGAVERAEEDRFERLDGSVDYNRWECRPWNRIDGSIGGMITYTEVITDRKIAEAALQKSEAIFNSFMEHCPVYVFFKDETTRPIRLSRNYEQMLGRPIEEILGKAMDELFPAEMAKKMVEDDLRVIRGGKPIKIIEELGGRLYETTKFPILQPGKPNFLAGFTIDITERRIADQQREKLESQLRQAQKMEAIGTLAGGIAHDFNNILSVIIGNTEILSMTDITFSSKNEVDQILVASKRAKELVRQILAFSRQGEQQKLVMSLKPVLKETIDFLRASIPANIQLQYHIHTDVGTITADPTQMQQVLMNLCTNAAHAMEKNGGVLKLELDTVTISEEGEDTELGIGQYVRIKVLDTGYGIEPAILPRIFDPYFTTKKPGKGTGMGLSVVHGIVKSHGGVIKARSEVSKGTVFEVFLPKTDGPVKAEEYPVQQLPIGNERILVVDDEEHIVQMYQRMLSLLGYQVDSRTSPVEALEAIRLNPNKYDIIITDMTMPQMSGFNLAKKVLEIRANLPVILSTGFSDQINEDKARAVGIMAFLLKPVLFNDLAAALRQVLDKTARA
jgi:PAS domain S-box-containing protein